MGGLIKNEYIKNVKKTSTKIMIVLIILAAFALSGIAAYAKSRMNDSYYSDINAIDDYKSQIEMLKKSKPDGYEIDVKYYQFLIDNNIEYNDYRNTYAYDILELFSDDSDEMLKNLNLLYVTDDWKTVCSNLKSKQTSEAEKWEYQYRLDNDIPFGETWKDSLISEIAASKYTISIIDKDNAAEDVKKELEEAIKTEKIGLYRLENNIEYNTADTQSLFEAYDADQITFWSVFFQSASLISVIGLLIIVVAGSSVASEFSNGTIKFLLINPVKRWKILVSKYITVVTLGYIMLLILYIVMIPAAGLLLGFEGFGAKYIYLDGDTIHTMSSFLYAAKLYLLNSVNIVMMATLAFAVSSLFRSSALAIGISVFMMFAGNTIILVLQQFNQDWGRYLLFSNTSLSSIASGNPIFPQQTILFAIGVLFAHWAVFFLTAWDGFVRREV